MAFFDQMFGGGGGSAMGAPFGGSASAFTSPGINPQVLAVLMQMGQRGGMGGGMPGMGGPAFPAVPTPPVGPATPPIPGVGPQQSDHLQILRMLMANPNLLKMLMGGGGAGMSTGIGGMPVGNGGGGINT